MHGDEWTRVERRELLHSPRPLFASLWEQLANKLCCALL